MDGQTIDYQEAVTGLRARLDAAMRMALDHMRHGCDVMTAMQGAAHAYADLLHDLGAGPDPETATVAEIMIAHGIPGPWDYMSTDAPDAVTVTTAAPITTDEIDAFMGDLDALESITPDGAPVFPWPDGDGIAGPSPY